VVTRRAAVGAGIAVVVAVLLVSNDFARRNSAASRVGEWYALHTARGNCARRFDDERFYTQFELIICRRSGRPFTCWELPVGLTALEGGLHKVELRHGRFDSACKAALSMLTQAGLRP
jgi:hypothetical protein